MRPCNQCGMPIGNDLLFCSECEPENSDHSWSAARETPSNEVTRVCWQYWANFAYNWVYAGSDRSNSDDGNRYPCYFTKSGKRRWDILRCNYWIWFCYNRIVPK